jgi:hypothetical protein
MTNGIYDCAQKDRDHTNQTGTVSNSLRRIRMGQQEDQRISLCQCSHPNICNVIQTEKVLQRIIIWQMK